MVHKGLSKANFEIASAYCCNTPAALTARG